MTMRPLGEVAAAVGAGFGTSGVRGLVTDLTAPLCAAYTRAFLSILPVAPQRLLIGQDLRPSSPAIALACRAAAESMGVATVNAGTLPTPALALAAGALGVPAIMVTGSHIPFDRNGLKFYRAEGEISKADEQRIMAFPVAVPLPEVTLAAAPAEVDPAPLALYRARYLEALGAGALEGLRIGVYEHSSVARDLLHKLLRELGASTRSLGRSEGFVAVDTEAVGEDDRARGLAWAAAAELDAIVTTDGDADRPLIADERGRWLRGDLLGLLCARALGAGTVVTPVNSTTAIELSGLFAQVRRTRIGSPHVIAAMQDVRHGPVVGFEANGGLLLGSDVTLAGRPLAALATRDAMLPILLVLAAARARPCPVSELVAALPERHTFSARLQDVDMDACRAVIGAAESGAAGMVEITGGSPVTAVDRTDGLRLTLAGGDILHVRPSGNAPELRCYAESTSEERAERLCLSCLSRLKRLLSGRSGSKEAGSG